MGRISAYTNEQVTYDEMMQSNLTLGPKTYAMGPVDIETTVPVSGTLRGGPAGVPEVWRGDADHRVHH